MTVITTADADWDVLTDVRDTLADAEISEGVPAFRQVVIGENADDFTATVTQTPAAFVRLVGQQEEATGDSADGRVALLEIEISPPMALRLLRTMSRPTPRPASSETASTVVKPGRRINSRISSSFRAET